MSDDNDDVMSMDFEYCPACASELDTGYECLECGRDWRPATVSGEGGIAINLEQLRDLMREFVIEQEPDADKRVGLDWTFEIFLQWLRRRQETTNEKSAN